MMPKTAKFLTSQLPIGLSEVMDLFDGNIPREIIDLFTRNSEKTIKEFRTEMIEIYLKNKL